MNSFLLNRSLGSIAPPSFKRAYTSELVQAIQLSSAVRFSQTKAVKRDEVGSELQCLAHEAGVNALAIDRFEGRYLLSGGADSAISIWDLEQNEANSDSIIYQPLASVNRAESSHKFGVTHLAFYPFDSLAFISSSYDHTVKVYSSETLVASATFDLTYVVYSHALSPIASHLLVACATQHQNVRLVDLRSGANTHSLAGHRGAVLSVAWNPVSEYVLASGGTDGVVRFWDVRRSAGSLGVLDMEDSIGMRGYDGSGKGARNREQGRAHSGAVNGISWTEDGGHLVTTGHDENIRVWDLSIGANTLAGFGPMIRNSHLATRTPLVAPKSLVHPGKDVLFYPNERDILMYELFEGTLLSRLHVPGTSIPSSNVGAGTGRRDFNQRTTALAWRAHNVELYSAHADGRIRVWAPRTTEDALVEEEERQEREGNVTSEAEERKRKRDALEDVFQSLTRQKITFS